MQVYNSVFSGQGCQLSPLSSSRTFHHPKGNPIPSTITPQPPALVSSLPVPDEPGLAMSHAWTHALCGLVCLVPSLRTVGSGLSPGRHMGASLLLEPEMLRRVGEVLPVTFC